MGARLKQAVLLAVLAAWLGYITLAFVHNQAIPLPVWSVPGATWALLTKTGEEKKEEEK